MLGNATNTTTTLANASSDITAGFANSMELAPVVGIVVAAAVIVGVLVPLLQSVTAYEWVLNTFSRISRSVRYAISGVITCIIVGVIAVPIYAISQLDGGTQSALGKAVIAIIVGYAALVAIGFVGEKVYGRIAEQHEAATGHRPFENWGEEPADD